MRVRLLPLALRTRSETSGAAEMSVAFAFSYTAVLLGGGYPGALAALASGLASSLLFTSRRHPFYRIAFNGASLVWSAWIAAMVLTRVGGSLPERTDVAERAGGRGEHLRVLSGQHA